MSASDARGLAPHGPGFLGTADAPGPRLEILVVDPDPATSAEVQHAVPDAHVCRAADAYCALNDVESGHVDLIVTELCLPGAGPVELLQRLRARGHRVPVVVLSHARGQVAALRALGVYALVAKPASRVELGDTLRLACEISARSLRSFVGR